MGWFKFVMKILDVVAANSDSILWLLLVLCIISKWCAVITYSPCQARLPELSFDEPALSSLSFFGTQGCFLLASLSALDCLLVGDPCPL
jgi:hypothetical protein